MKNTAMKSRMITLYEALMRCQFDDALSIDIKDSLCGLAEDIRDGINDDNDITIDGFFDIKEYIVDCILSKKEDGLDWYIARVKSL